jgi:hypothetical protein
VSECVVLVVVVMRRRVSLWVVWCNTTHVGVVVVVVVVIVVVVVVVFDFVFVVVDCHDLRFVVVFIAAACCVCCFAFISCVSRLPLLCFRFVVLLHAPACARRYLPALAQAHYGVYSAFQGVPGPPGNGLEKLCALMEHVCVLRDFSSVLQAVVVAVRVLATVAAVVVVMVSLLLLLSSKLLRRFRVIKLAVCCPLIGGRLCACVRGVCVRLRACACMLVRARVLACVRA